MRKHDERGASLVEFALVLPLLLMLLVGIVSAGIAYNHRNSMVHGVREASRFGATLPADPSDVTAIKAWLDDVASRTVEDATGSLDPGVEDLYICVAYYFPDGDGSTDFSYRRIEDHHSDPPITYTPKEGCGLPDGALGGERRVQVVAERAGDLEVVFFSVPLTLRTSAVSRFEAFRDFG